MKLWLQRHGHAGAFSRDPKKERSRPLTSEGQQTVRAIAQRMIGLGEQPTVIVCSPFQRAVDTATIMGKLLKIEVQQHTQLQPQFPISRLLTSMFEADEKWFKRVLLIGHHDNMEPFLAKYSPKDGPASVEAFAMGEVRRVEIDRDSLVSVEQMRIRPESVGRPMRY